MVQKRDGRNEQFMPAKIVLSLIRTGVPAGHARTIARNIERTARDCIETRDIRIKVLCMLMAGNPEWVKKRSVYGTHPSPAVVPGNGGIPQTF
jgi:hypothetical protein